MHADHGWTCAPVNAAGNERGGARGRPSTSQVGLAAGAVVVQTYDHRPITVAAAHNWTLPLKRKVPPCPCFLYLCLDLWGCGGNKARKYIKLRFFSKIRVQKKYFEVQNVF